MTAPNKPKPQTKPPVKYTGPAEPIPTHRESMSDRAELIWFVVLAVVFLTMLALGLLDGSGV
jgi:nitrate reductase NapE component